jgi:signal recognition particle subunit SRP54
LVSVDVYRPAARKQLSVLAHDLKLPIYEGAPEETKPVDLARSARKEAIQTGRDILLVDTAGRLHIDEDLMTELTQLKELLNPTEILFVADAMTGQDAVKSADEFHKRLGITGIILTKMDGDARGGAALSIRAVTGQPLKFIGVGEKSDALEPFHPDRVAQRILGMGDVLSLIEKVEETIDHKQAEEMQRKLIEDDFTLGDFRDQMKQVRKLGPLENLLGMMPDMGGALKGLKNAKIDEKEVTRLIAIVDSMTPRERANHMLINGQRRKRIAKGSGTSVQEVNTLLKQYAEMRKMMKQFTGGGFLGKRLGKMKLPAGLPFGR